MNVGEKPYMKTSWQSEYDCAWFPERADLRIAPRGRMEACVKSPRQIKIIGITRGRDKLPRAIRYSSHFGVRFSFSTLRALLDEFDVEALQRKVNQLTKENKEWEEKVHQLTKQNKELEKEVHRLKKQNQDLEENHKKTLLELFRHVMELCLIFIRFRPPRYLR